MPRRYVLDTSLLLGGRDPPSDGLCSTTPEAASEVSHGGKDHRRFEQWLAAGLRIESATPEVLERVADAALAAGNLGRLSPADLSLLALALTQQATLVTDDFTILDLGMRLSIATQTVNQQAPRATLDFRPRCSGCGRWFDAMPKKEECPVCGSAVKLKPAGPGTKGPATASSGTPAAKPASPAQAGSAKPTSNPASTKKPT